ncbi:MAG: adenylyl-sulfate kinase [Bacteroidota bacterium]|nr:adenylyl-sulfate kinase [Bacteroidota bacterium]
MIIQLTGLSGSGKTTLAGLVKQLLENDNRQVEVIDGDIYRKTLCKDLGFSREDRCENIRRLGAVAHSFVCMGKIAIIAAINPFEFVRLELKEKYLARTAWIKCDIGILSKRDTKGLYKRSLLPDDHPDKIFNLTGINDIYETPFSPDLVIDTGNETVGQSTQKLYQFIIQHIPAYSSLSFPLLHTVQMPFYNKEV